MIRPSILAQSVRTTFVLLAAAAISSCSTEAGDSTNPTIVSVTVEARGGGNGPTPTVDDANPGSLPKGTVNADLEILGSGFTSSSEVSFELDGVSIDEILTNSVTFIDETRLVANVDVSSEALETFYDIAVRNGPKKKGVGIDLLKVTAPPPADPALVFRIGGTTDQIRVVDATGANETVVWESEWMFAPAFSPGGAKVVFGDVVSDGLYTLDVAVVDGVPVATNLTLLWSDAPPVSPDWSPNGTEIVTSGGNPNGIWVTAADGSAIEMIYQAPEGKRAAWPTWSPAGDHVAFVEYYRDESDHRLLRVVDRADGSIVATRVLSEYEKSHSPSWQRTAGSGLVALSGTPVGVKKRFRTDRVFVVDVFADTPPVEIAEGKSPSWSPDDTEVAYLDSSTGKLLVKDLSTGLVRTLAQNAGAPDWRR